MSSSILLLILAAGIPYYIVLEKIMSSKAIFLVSGFLLLGAIVASYYVPNEHLTLFVDIAFVSAIFSIYKATKTTNFYKLGYYLIFVNAPFFILFEEKGALYSLSLLVSLIGIFFIGRFYEKSYASANYHYIRGITLSTPYIGTYLTMYLISLALYPPFPNALFFLSHIVNADTSLLWFVVVITLFFGNFYLAMKVMKESLFGKPNPNIHYVDLTQKEKVIHSIIVLALLFLSITGIKELLL
jgi:hypothetical protein